MGVAAFMKVFHTHHRRVARTSGELVERHQWMIECRRREPHARGPTGAMMVAQYNKSGE